MQTRINIWFKQTFAKLNRQFLHNMIIFVKKISHKEYRIFEKKKDHPSNIEAALKGIHSRSRIVWTVRYIEYRGKKHFAPAKTGKKTRHIRHHARACQRVSCHTLTHADMQISRNDIPKLPFAAAVVRWWRHGQRARANHSYMLIVTHLVQPEQAAKDVRVYMYTESSKDYDVLDSINRRGKR